MLDDPPPMPNRDPSRVTVYAKPCLRLVRGDWWVYIAATVAFKALDFEDACATAKAWEPIR